MAIRNGPDETSPMIGRKRCGNNVPAPIISEGNELHLHLHSDYSVTSSGFEIKVETAAHGIFMAGKYVS